MEYQNKRKKTCNLIFQMLDSLKKEDSTGDLKALSAEVSIQTGMKIKEVEEIIRTFEQAKRITIKEDTIVIN